MENLKQVTTEQDRPLGACETHNLPIIAYRDDDGNPTCASDFMNGRICIFYTTQKFGTIETCSFPEYSGAALRIMDRRNKGGDMIGTLIPVPACPLWPKD